MCSLQTVVDLNPVPENLFTDSGGKYVSPSTTTLVAFPPQPRLPNGFCICLLLFSFSAPPLPRPWPALALERTAGKAKTARPRTRKVMTSRKQRGGLNCLAHQRVSLSGSRHISGCRNCTKSAFRPEMRCVERGSSWRTNGADSITRGAGSAVPRVSVSIEMPTLPPRLRVRCIACSVERPC